MQARSPAQWNSILRAAGVAPREANLWDDHFAAVLVPGSLSLGDEELDDFLGNVLHESSGLTRMVEGLFYRTPERLMQVWPRRFRTVESALPYVGNSIALAEKVYGGRMGNTSPGDGYAYRGSGAIMVTGKDNFAALEAITGLPLVRFPDMLRRPGVEALRVCVAWWERNVPDSVMREPVRVRKAVNGGAIGLSDVLARSDQVRQALVAA